MSQLPSWGAGSPCSPSSVSSTLGWLGSHQCPTRSGGHGHVGDVDVGTWSNRGAWRRPLGWFLIWGGLFSGGCDLWVGEALLEMDVAGSVWWAGTGRRDSYVLPEPVSIKASTAMELKCANTRAQGQGHILYQEPI